MMKFAVPVVLACVFLGTFVAPVETQEKPVPAKNANELADAVIEVALYEERVRTAEARWRLAEQNLTVVKVRPIVSFVFAAANPNCHVRCGMVRAVAADPQSRQLRLEAETIREQAFDHYQATLRIRAVLRARLQKLKD